MTKNIWMAGTCVCVVALAAMTLWHRREMAEVKAACAAKCAAATEQAQARVKSARKADRVAEEARQAASEAGVSVRPASASAAIGQPVPGRSPAEAMGSNFMSAVAGMMKNPQMKEMIQAQQKVVVRQMYGKLPRYLDLSSETQKRLNALLLERQMALAESGLAMMSGSAEDRKKVADDVAQVRQAFDAEIRALLGEEDYATFEQYEQTLAEQSSVSMFKNALSDNDRLSEQQEEELIAAMYQARKELPADSMVNRQDASPDPSQFNAARIEETLKQMETLQKRYAESAAAILSESQLVQFKQWQEQMAASQAVGLKMAAQMFGQGKESGAK